MNREALEEIRDWLRAGTPEKSGITGLDMRTFVSRDLTHDCGTTCCIAGAAIQFDRVRKGLPICKTGIDLANDSSGYTISDNARKILGISPEKAEILFFGDTLISLYDITPEWAANCIDHFLETGEVNWLVTKPKDNEA